jgi:polar amino acid transport system substrate-binding protein
MEAKWIDRLSVGLACALSAWAPAQAADLTAYTEEWAPYNYSENGVVKGIATDVLRAACAQASLECEFKVVPWARAMAMVSSTSNTLLYTTARKPSREQDFLWVGPLMPRTTWVYVNYQNNGRINDFASLGKSRIGIVRDEASQADLSAAGVPVRAFTMQSSNAHVLRMMLSGALDAMVDTEVGMAWNLRDAAQPAHTVVKKMKLSDEGAYYFALNRDTKPSMVRDLQLAVDALRREGRIDVLVKQYTEPKK